MTQQLCFFYYMNASDKCGWSARPFQRQNGMQLFLRLPSLLDMLYLYCAKYSVTLIGFHYHSEMFLMLLTNFRPKQLSQLKTLHLKEKTD